jgi:hypothetical protein
MVTVTLFSAADAWWVMTSMPKSSSFDRYSLFPALPVATPSTLSCAKSSPVGSSWLSSVPTRYEAKER